MDLDLKAALAVAQAAAQVGAEAIAQGYRNQDLTVKNKGLIDLVTQYDLKSEWAIRAIIKKAFPSHDLLAEEEGLDSANPQAPRWHVDPLDGTTNFAHQHPFFAVSVALSVPEPAGWKTLVAVVRAPILREVFWAIRGQGAFLQSLDHRQDGQPLANARQLRVSSANRLVQSLVNTGFPYDVHTRAREIVAPFERMLGQVQAVRRAGAASLDLAFVAAGRAEGYWETGLKPWDVAAGALLVEEAGGQVTDGQGAAYQLEKSPTILASNGLIHQEMVSIINEL
ncbi:MAG: inositol monophosphatase [Deltaproteobacteria bacterium]|jgi:myo-inositol-1(or 4)-monophosphatase|nr:inositol monophosphatase [Deltaproteobacteria bacterium]